MVWEQKRGSVCPDCGIPNFYIIGGAVKFHKVECEYCCSEYSVLKRDEEIVWSKGKKGGNAKHFVRKKKKKKGKKIDAVANLIVV